MNATPKTKKSIKSLGTISGSSTSNSSLISNINKSKQRLNSKNKKSPNNAPKILTIICYKCKLSQNINEIYKHLEFNCEYFVKPYKNKIEDKDKIQEYFKLVYNSISTPDTEPICNKSEYLPGVIKAQEDLKLSSHDKQTKFGNKNLKLIKELEVENMEVGQIPLKSHQFEIFGLFIRGRYIKHYIAWRSKDNIIEVQDLTDIIIPKMNHSNNNNYNNHINNLSSSRRESKFNNINTLQHNSSNSIFNFTTTNNLTYTLNDTLYLEGHEDLITEIRYFKTKKELNILMSCSYDCTAILWDIQQQFKLNCIIEYNTWVLTGVITTLLNLDSADIVILSGGFIKSNPISVFSLETQEELFSLKLKEEVIPHIIEVFPDANLLVVATDIECPRLLLYDYLNKTHLKTFQYKAAISSMSLYHASSKQVVLITSDYNGNIRQFDIMSMSCLGEFNTQGPIMDFCIWDDFYLMSCGDNKQNSLKTLMRSKMRVGKVFDNIHERVVLNIKKYYLPNLGMCMVSMGADKRIKIHKF